MENTIKFFLSTEDAEYVQKIFDRKENPKFIITSRFQIPDTDVVVVEILFESTTVLWFMIKEIEMCQSHDRRMQQFIDNAIKKVNDGN